MAKGAPICDVCGKQCKEVKAKLYLSPVRPGETQFTASRYTGHADVGECCVEKVAGFAKWQRRRTVPRKTSSRALRKVS